MAQLAVWLVLEGIHNDGFCGLAAAISYFDVCKIGDAGHGRLMAFKTVVCKSVPNGKAIGVVSLVLVLTLTSVIDVDVNIRRSRIEQALLLECPVDNLLVGAAAMSLGVGDPVASVGDDQTV